AKPESAHTPLDSSLDAIIKLCQSDDILNLTGNKRIAQKYIKKARVIIHKVKGRMVYAVDKDLVHHYLPKNHRKGVLTLLTKQGVLLSDVHKDYSTVQIVYKRHQVGRRYCFVCNKLNKIMK
ncbi:TPA: DNA/RNA helicase, partial [Salmonella enterica]|nr:DNA/RNA helicase [Salmonella enterica]